MPQVSITIPNSVDWFSYSSRIEWYPGTGDLLPLGATLSSDGTTDLFLGRLILRRSEGGASSKDVTIWLSDSQSSSPAVGQDFSTQMEDFGVITLTASDGSVLSLTNIGDKTEPYAWDVSNATEVYAFANTLVGLTDKSLTVVFFDKVHAINAGNVEHLWQTPQIAKVDAGNVEHLWQTPQIAKVDAGNAEHLWQTPQIAKVDAGNAEHLWQTPQIVKVDAGNVEHSWQTQQVAKVNAGNVEHLWESHEVGVNVRGKWFCAGNNKLWNIDIANPTNTTSPYGEIGDIFDGTLVGIHALCYISGKLIGFRNNGTVLYINPKNPADQSGDYGVSSNSVDTNPYGATILNGILYVVGLNNSDWELVRVNPNNPSDTTGDYGVVGNLPSGVGTVRAVAGHNGKILVFDRESPASVWLIDPTSPGNTGTGYGEQSLPSGLDAPTGASYGDGRLIVIDNAGDDIWYVDTSDFDSSSGDYGKIGDLPSGLTDIINITYVPDYEADASSENYVWKTPQTVITKIAAGSNTHAIDAGNVEHSWQTPQKAKVYAGNVEHLWQTLQVAKVNAGNVEHLWQTLQVAKVNTGNVEHLWQTLQVAITKTDGHAIDASNVGHLWQTLQATITKTDGHAIDADNVEHLWHVPQAIPGGSNAPIISQAIPNHPFVLFEKERNHTTTPSEAGDNDHSTWTAETTIECAIQDSNGNDTTFDHIFVRGSGITSYRILLDKVARGIRTLPINISVTDAFPTIADVSILRNSWQHDLLALDTAMSGSEVTLVFSGSDIKINEVLILKKTPINNQDYITLTHSKIDVNTNLDKTQSGEFSRALLSRGDRLRWRSNCQLEFTNIDEDCELLLDWIDGKPDIVVAHDPELYPWRIYRAKFLNSRYNAAYLSKVFEQGNSLSFQIQEKRPIGSKLIPTLKKTFNTEDSQKKHLFFNDCIHLNNNRITTSSGTIENKVCDNNFKTFSEETTLIFDISDNEESTNVTHIWLKAVGVTSYQVQTLVSDVWTTQQTITPAKKTYASWDNSLEKLTTLISATSIRLVFAGTNIKISEVMLLYHAGGLVSIRELSPVKIDRNAVTSKDDSGEIQQRTLGSDRFKWELDFSAAFSQGNIHALENFIDWADSNPNFTFAERPEEKPWRVYPASFLNEEFPIVPITNAIQIGEMVSFQLGER